MSQSADHSERDHAKYAPSAAHRWLSCPGSVKLSEGIKERSSSYAQEGTECHEAASEILEGNTSFEKATANLSDDQTWIVEEYTNYVFNLIDRLQAKFDDVKVWIEQRVRAPFISDLFHGTADCGILAGRTLGIVDLKAGFGEVVVKDDNGKINPQLLSYALLFVETHELWYAVDKVRLTIVQPRVYDKPQTVTIEVNDLMDFKFKVRDQIQAIESEALTNLSAGKHCKFCPARGRCPELRQSAVDKAKFAFDGAKEPRLYTPEELAAILNEAEMIQAHVDGVRQHVMRELEKGRMRGMGWKLVPKRASYKWTSFEDIEPKLKLMIGTNGTYGQKPRTPLQIQKALKEKGYIDFDISGHFVKESSGLTLAPESDPREEVTPNPFGD